MRSLSRLALAFVVLFAALVAGSLIPMQLLDPTWQRDLCRTLLDGGILPLLALALLQIAVALDPEDRLLNQRQRRFSRLAGAAALGFLLLLPLQVTANLRLQQSGGSEQVRRLDRAERQLLSFRQAITKAGSNAELADALQKLGGPRPAPADLALPLPLLKAQANAALDRVQLGLSRQRSALPSRNPLRILPDLLKPSIAALALAFGYASFARGRDSELSLVDDWQLSRRRQLQRSRPGRQTSHEDYIRQLSAEQDDKPGA